MLNALPDMTGPISSKPFLQVTLPLGGVVLFFSVGSFFGGTWGAVLASMIPVGLYVCYMGLQVIKRAKSRAEKGLGLSVLLVLAALIATNGHGAFQRSEWKRYILIDVVRQSVDWGRMTRTANTHLLKTLRAHYDRLPKSETPSPKERGQEGLKGLFEKQYSDRLEQGKGLIELVPPALEDMEYPIVYYESMETEDGQPGDQRIVLIGRSAAGNGQDSGFVGYDQREGHMQYRFVLTKEGLTYDREN